MTYPVTLRDYAWSGQRDDGWPVGAALSRSPMLFVIAVILLTRNSRQGNGP
jgi:hypothetical protein